MFDLSVEEMTYKIKNKELFSANLMDKSFSITINSYVPYICTAIHNGNNFSEELKNKLNLSPFERWQEEDPLTEEFIRNLPIKIVCNDSRYEYDINRDEKNCIYETAWGKNVWKEKLNEVERNKILIKHRNFYKILYVLIQKIESLYGASIIYDIHSYNWQRKSQKIDCPLFNLGTEKIDSKRYKIYIDNFKKNLGKIKFENIKDTKNLVSENEVFYGRGYLLQYILNNFKNTLVLATEIKKIYCDENSGEVFPTIIQNLKKTIEFSILETSDLYIKNETYDYKK